MNILAYNFLFIISFFPLWIFTFNVSFKIRFFTITILLFLTLIQSVIFKYLKKKELFFYLYLSLIITLGIDNSLSLFSDFLSIYFKDLINYFYNYYLLGIFFILILWIINFFLIKKLKFNGIKIILAFILSILIYNFYFSDKSFKYFPDFNTKNKSHENFNSKTILFILDQMTGLNSPASNTEEGQFFNNIAINFARKHKASIYQNIYSSCRMTHESIPLMLNLNNDNCEMQNSYFIERANSFYNRDIMLKNKFFENFQSISVYQNFFINYCAHKRVTKCDQYSQFKKYSYIEGTKDNNLSFIIGGWKHHGSILANLLWRILLQLNIISSFEQSGGEKVSFLARLDDIKKDIISDDYDLILFHSLVSHEPYGFSKECKFDNKKYSDYRKYSYLQKIKGHNFDRICTLRFIDKFLDSIENTKSYKNLNFIIISDHGTRIEPNPIEDLNSILIYKNFNDKLFKQILEKKNIQDEFSRIKIN